MTFHYIYRYPYAPLSQWRRQNIKFISVQWCNDYIYCVNWYYSLAFLVKSHNSTSLWNNTMNLFMRLFLYEAINCLYPHGQLLYSIWVLRYEKTTYCKSISNQHGDIWRTITSTKSCISKLLDTNIVTGGSKRFHEKNPRPKFLTWHWHTDMHGQNMPW